MKTPLWLGIPLTFILAVFVRVLFVSNTFTDAWYVLRGMFNFSTLHLSAIKDAFDGQLGYVAFKPLWTCHLLVCSNNKENDRTFQTKLEIPVVCCYTACHLSSQYGQSGTVPLLPVLI